jgi:hypothetical protein
MSETEIQLEEKKERPHFTRYLTEPDSAKRFKPNEDVPRAIPWESGNWDNDGFVKISDDGNSVTFKLQTGNFNDNGYNGCYPIMGISFFKCLYESYQNRDRETNMIITDLERVISDDIIRSVKRSKAGTHGTGK